MAEESLSYAIPADSAGNPGSQVDLTLTYDPSSADGNGYVTVTAATGTYQTVDSSGNVIDKDTVTGLLPPVAGSYGTPDNKLFIGTGSPYVTSGEFLSRSTIKLTAMTTRGLSTFRLRMARIIAKTATTKIPRAW